MSFLFLLQNNDLNVKINWSPPEFASGEIAKYGIEIKAVNNTVSKIKSKLLFILNVLFQFSVEYF